MRIYKFKNVTVYITNPTEDHLRRIRKATKTFLQQIEKERNRVIIRGNNR